jgi:ParB family chromosome partitioning protein
MELKMSKTKNALGRGLSSLISEGDDSDADKQPTKASENTPDQKSIVTASSENEGGLRVVMIPLSDLIPGRFQPRGYFDEDKLNELAASIKESGVLQPILVRSSDEKGKYQIIAGERRWRASRQAGLEKIPAVVKELDDKAALEAALVENIQRQSLTPIEEADGYKKLIEEFSYTQENLASNLGKSRSHITNMMRLLQLPDEVKDLINSGSLMMGHARALVGVENPVGIAHEIVKKGLSVREAEKFAAGSGKLGGGSKGAARPRVLKSMPQTGSDLQKDEDLLGLERTLSENLGLKVTVEDSEEGGKVTLYFNNLSELDKILQKIG